MDTAKVLPIRKPTSLEWLMENPYTAKELIDAIHGVERAVNQLRSDHADIHRKLGERLVAVETIVGDERSGVVRHVNQNRRDIDRLKSVFFTYLPMSLTTLMALATLYSIFFQGS